jgi:serine phosphatase RsbU (regulator of sigma subunit)
MQASTAFTVSVTLFNIVAAEETSQPVFGLLAVSPMLAAVLVQRAARVALAAGFAALAFVVGSFWLGVAWDVSQDARIAAMLTSTVVGIVAAQSRMKEANLLFAVGEVAKTAQRAIMRMDPPQADGVDAAVRYVSASTEANIGGDAYEAVLTPFGLRVLVADARGKGLPAVLSSSIAVGSFREWAFIEEDLGDLIGRMNASVAREVADADFVTALVAEFCVDQLHYVSAGHPPPLLLRDGCARELEVEPVPPLSLISGSNTPAVASLQLRRNDVVLMYSDGLSDARNARGEFFGVADSLVRVAVDAASVQECADGILAELRDFVAEDLEDDVALVALRVTRAVEPMPEEAVEI